MVIGLFGLNRKCSTLSIMKAVIESVEFVIRMHRMELQFRNDRCTETNLLQ